jgi:hypothetical protein
MNPAAQKARKTVASEESEKRPTDKTAANPAPTAKTGRALRKSSRLSVREASQPCELKVEATVLPAALMNESRTGFSVLLDCRDGLQVGGKVELRTAAGHVSGEIVYIRKITSCAYSATKCNTLFQVGVKKTRCFFVT